MKRLASVLFGLFGLLYGTTTWAEIMCCPENQQCGDVCCPKKGCNTEGTGCAENGCNAKAGYGLWISECTYCPDIAEGYYVDASGRCVDCNWEGYGFYNGYCGYCPNVGGDYVSFDGYCVPCSSIEDRGYGLDRWGGGYCVYCPALYDYSPEVFVDSDGYCQTATACADIDYYKYGFDATIGQCADCSAGYGTYWGKKEYIIPYCTDCRYEGEGYGRNEFGYCAYCPDLGGYALGPNGDCIPATDCSSMGEGYGLDRFGGGGCVYCPSLDYYGRMSVYDGYCFHCPDVASMYSDGNGNYMWGWGFDAEYGYCTYCANMGPGYAPIVRPNQDTSHPNYATCGYCPDMGPGYGIYYGYCMHCESIDAKLDANGYCATEYYP